MNASKLAIAREAMRQGKDLMAAAAYIGERACDLDLALWRTLGTPTPTEPLPRARRVGPRQTGLMIRAASKVPALLVELEAGPKCAADLAHLFCDRKVKGTGAVARTMGYLARRGLAVNKRPGQEKALYAITDHGLAALATLRKRAA